MDQPIVACITSECDRKAFARKMCSTHYTKWLSENPDLKRKPRVNRCGVNSCRNDKAEDGAGYCDLHHRRLQETGSLSAYKQVRWVGDKKECPRCGVLKERSEYHKQAARESGISHYCKVCNNERARANRNADGGVAHRENRRRWYRETLEKRRAESRRRYQRDPVKAKLWWWKSQGIDITPDMYVALHKQQGGICAICSKTEEANGKALAVDHDHETGRVRGLLCDDCNLALGRFQDSPDVLRRAINYLGA